MPRTSYRTFALLFVSALIVALVAVTLIPGFGRAQEATPGNGDTSDNALLSQGEGIYKVTCIACHQAGGEGAESEVAFTHYPALAGNPFVTIDDPTAVIQTVLHGRAGMPSFRNMSDEEIASVLTYIRQSWGNDASPVDPDLVSDIRSQRQASPRPPATPFPSPALTAATPVGSPEGGPATPVNNPEN